MDRRVLAHVPAVSGLGRTGPRSGFCNADRPGCCTPARDPAFASVLRCRASGCAWGGTGSQPRAVCAWPRHGEDGAHAAMAGLEETQNVFWEAWVALRWEGRP